MQSPERSWVSANLVTSK